MASLPRTLLITAGGLVGGNIYRVLIAQGFQFSQTYFPACEEPAGYPVDITDGFYLRQLFLRIRPEVVILNAALTNVEFCQDHQEQARNINVGGTANVVDCCKETGAKLVFFSSDYVFDGQNGPYSEEDKTNPVSFYGQTKLEGEAVIREKLPDHLIIRTTGIFGIEKLQKNFCYRLINTLKQAQTIKVPKDQIGNPTCALNLAEVVIDLVKKNKNGVYNVVGRDLMDRYQFSLAICSEFGLNPELIIPVATSELHQLAKRPLKAGLKIDKVLKDSDVAILGVKEALARFREEYNG